MAIYTIGDLHLSFSEDKPMSIFGEKWEGHEEKNYLICGEIVGDNISDAGLYIFEGNS